MMSGQILKKVFGTVLESERAYLAAWTICKVSGHEDKNLVKAIVTYFDHYLGFVDLMKWIISKEVENMQVSEGSVPFREDSVSTALLLHFGQNSSVCLNYLKEVVKPTINKIKNLACPTQQGAVQETIGTNELLDVCADLVNNVTTKAHLIPLPYLEIMKHLSLCINRRFPGGRTATSAIVGIFLLRFVIRSIAFPEHYFHAKKVAFPFRKLLVKVSKVLQKLSSIEDDAPVEGNELDLPDTDPVIVINFIKESRQKIKGFFLDISRTVPAFAPQSWGADKDPKEAAKTIVHHINEHEEVIRREVPGLLPNTLGKTKSRANSTGDVDIDLESFSSLNTCLNNPLARDRFQQFATNEHSEVPLLFWIEAEKFSRNPTQQYAMEIFAKFLEAGASNQLDTEKGTRTSLRELIRNGPVDSTLFAKVQNMVFANMAGDSFPRFKQSITANAR
jgi:hypothetical protein